MRFEHTLHIDIETRSSADIASTGSYKYAQDKDFTILLVAYAVDDAPVRLIDLTQPTDPFEVALFADRLTDANYLKMAHNAAFEWYCFNRFGWETPLDQWQCTMIHAAYCGYPMSLESVGKAIGLPQDKQKLMTGKALIRYFCTPAKPTKSNGGRKWNQSQDDPEKWGLFKDYCKQDVEAEREIENMLSRYPVPDTEWDLWRQDIRMNARGIRVDRKLIEGALYCTAVTNERLTNEAKQITGLDNPNSTTQLLEWLSTHHPLPNLQKTTVAEALEGDLEADVRRVLEIRQQLGKTSNKKYQAAANAMCEDDHIRGVSQFYGANRSGRWSGRLVQLQNLPR